MKSLLLLWLALSGPLGFQQAVLVLSGASCVEELSEDEMARYQSLAAHPADLNAAGRSRLLATGLLTPFQVASLLDYRTRSGEVLSWTELGLVDGFTPEIVAALQEFFVLGGSGGAPGQREDRRVRHSLTLRGGARGSLAADGTGLAFGAPAAVGGLKYELTLGERVALYYSNRSSYSEPTPGWGTVSAAYYGRRVLGQLVVGHFQARFGQGLVQWSGFSLSGYNSLGAFRRNGTGFAPTGSYSPSLFGVAADWHFGAWSVSAGNSLGSSLEEIAGRMRPVVDGSGVADGSPAARFFAATQPMVNVSRNWRSASAGVTATREAVSLEGRLALPGWALFGEVAGRFPGVRGMSAGTSSVASSESDVERWMAQAVAGAIWVPAYGHKAGVVGRWLGRVKEYSGLALGYEGPALSCTADAAVRPDTRAFQLKSLLQWHPTYTLSGHSPAPVSPKSSSPSDPEIHRGSSFRLIDHPITLKPLLRLQLRYRPSDAVLPKAVATTVPYTILPIDEVYTTKASSSDSMFPISRTLSSGSAASPFASACPMMPTSGAMSPLASAVSSNSDTAFPFAGACPATTSPEALSPLASATSSNSDTFSPFAGACPMMPTSGAMSPLASAVSSSSDTVFPFAGAGVRLDIRGMVTATFGPWSLAGRYDAVLGRGFAWNWYVELGWKPSEAFSVYGRGGIFKVDDWDDRIYVYERDAPGSFTVPARYGRGWDAALYAAWRPARRHSLWLRLETVRYPWSLTPKDGRLELRLQYRYQR
ncbi:MAG: hypothetical protein IJ653_02680 [Bacteroidales bacterium]|nr:hypothetical protein [Bacteroidales bacterium]